MTNPLPPEIHYAGVTAVPVCLYPPATQVGPTGKACKDVIGGTIDEIE
jgi:hypothetical protein